MMNEKINYPTNPIQSKKLDLTDYRNFNTSVDFTQLKNLISLDEFHADIYKKSQEFLQNYPMYSDYIIPRQVQLIPNENRWYFVAEQDFSQRKFLQAKLNLKAAPDSIPSPNWALFDIKNYTKENFIVRIIKPKNRYCEQRYNIQRLKKHYLLYTISKELAINIQTNSDNSQFNHFSQDSSFPEKMIDEQMYQQGKLNQQYNNLQKIPSNSFVSLTPNKPVQQQQPEEILIDDDVLEMQNTSKGNEIYKNNNNILINNQPINQNTNRLLNINANLANMEQEIEIPTFKNQQQPILNIQQENLIYQNALNQNISNHKQNSNVQNQQQNKTNQNYNGNLMGGLIQNNNRDHSQELQDQTLRDQRCNNKVDQKYNQIKDTLSENIIIMDLLNDKDEKIARQKNKLKLKTQLIEQQENQINLLMSNIVQKDEIVKIQEEQIKLQTQYQNQLSKNADQEGQQENQIKLLKSSIVQKDEKIKSLEEQINSLKTYNQNELSKDAEEEIENLVQNLQKYQNLAKEQKDVIDQQDNKIKHIEEQNQNLLKENEMFKMKCKQFDLQMNNLNYFNIQNIQNLQQSNQQLQNELNKHQNESQQQLLKLRNQLEIKNKRYKLFKKTHWLIKHQVINLQKSYKIAYKDYEKSKKKEKISKADQETQTELSNQNQINENDEKPIKINTEEEEYSSNQNEVELSEDINKIKEEQELSVQESNKQEEVEKQEQFEEEFQENQEVYQQIDPSKQEKEQQHIDTQFIESQSTMIDPQNSQINNSGGQQMTISQINQLLTIIEEEKNNSQFTNKSDELYTEKNQEQCIEKNLEQLTDKQILEQYKGFRIEGQSDEEFLKQMKQNIEIEKTIIKTQNDQQIAINLSNANM
ncbi:hypothetical protein ABPG74_009282 [Tetrahymena malaccensis]